ncbi:MAG: hypothetical protein JNK63_04510 [Chthonomonas sp.]|nr:hypothetical protein [Chthonomonas sp.]
MRPIVICLLFVFVRVVLAIDYAQLHSDLDKAKGHQSVQRVLREHNVANEADAVLADKAGQAVAVPLPSSELIKEIRADVRLRAFASEATSVGKADVSKLKRAKSSPIYNDPGTRTEANWLQKSLESLGEWLGSLFKPKERQTPTAAPPNFGILPEVLTTIVWIVVGVIAIAAGALAIHLIARSRRAVSRAKGIMSDEEATLTLDEWLAKADALIAKGEFREAVRCLYVACLLRLDQAKALDFRRHETNWEHYNRYATGIGQPAFDLKPPTQEFDTIWYGNRTRGLEDAERFRGYYNQLLTALGDRRPA